MDMDMSAERNECGGDTDGRAEFDDRLTLIDGTGGDLVPERQRSDQGDIDSGNFEGLTFGEAGREHQHVVIGSKPDQPPVGFLG